jgi:transposase
MTPEHKAKIGATNHRRFIESQERELLETMKRLYAEGNACQSIAATVGKSPMTVYRWLKNAGVEVQRGKVQKGKQWSAARRVHHPEKPQRDPNAPKGRDIIVQRAIGNKSITTHGYVVVNLGRRKRQYEHILIAERALGKPLPAGVDVHHVNLVKHDNANTNLVICTHQYHLDLHARMRRHPYWSQFCTKQITD